MTCDPSFRKHYDDLVCRYADGPSCAPYLPAFSSLHVADWLSALAFERLYRKSSLATALADRFEGDWTAAVYVLLARALGFGTNAEPFERLALSLPLRVLMKHGDSPLSVEAMLFGQSGFLDEAPSSDPYCARLKEEYAFMSPKFGLQAPPSLGWKT